MEAEAGGVAGCWLHVKTVIDPGAERPAKH